MATAKIQIPPEVLAQLSELESTDEILRDKQNHSPARLDARRGELRDYLIAQWKLAQSSLKSQAATEAAQEIAAFTEAMRAKHGPVLSDIDNQIAAAMDRKGEAMDEIRALTAECNDLDKRRAELLEQRSESAKILAIDLAQNGWSKSAVGDWNGAVDILESVCNSFGLQFKIAASALWDYCHSSKMSKKGFRAAITSPVAFNHKSWRN